MDFTLPTIDWPTLLPVIAVSVTGVVALLIEIIWPKRNNALIVGLSLAGLAYAAYLLVPLFAAESGYTAARMLVRDHAGLVLQFVLIGICFFSFIFSDRYLREKGIAFGEFYPLALWTTAGGMIMVSTTNLLMMFLGLEVLSISLYCLVGMSRTEKRSEEAALKYFLLGAFASAFFLYGVALIYGASGRIDLRGIPLAFNTGYSEWLNLSVLGLFFILVGLLFKAALAPFQQWAPDVYQGAPTNVTAFMSAASKVAAFGALYRVLFAASATQPYWMEVMFWIAILTMVVGNLFAIAQKDVKRILAYSSIAHAGYILVGLLSHVRAPDKVGLEPVLYYLVGYSVMTIAAFAVLTLVATKGKDYTRLQDLNGLWKKSPLAAGTLVVCMVSMVGIPPTVGFVGKLGFFQSALDARLAPLAIVLAITSAISVYYYWGIIRASLVDDESAVGLKTSRMSPGLATICVVGIIGVIGLGISANPVIKALKKPKTDTVMEELMEQPPEDEVFSAGG